MSDANSRGENTKDDQLTVDPGNRVVKLPYINFMRELGATFLNAYTNSPICCPSRAGTVPNVQQLSVVEEWTYMTLWAFSYVEWPFCSLDPVME